MVAVVGPSGSGKTTLLRVAAGLERPGAGDVLLDGERVPHLPPERREVTVMFQEPHLFTHLDVTGNVAFPPVAGQARRDARAEPRYLELVHLEGLGPASRPVRRPAATGGPGPGAGHRARRAAARRAVQRAGPRPARGMHDLLGRSAPRSPDGGDGDPRPRRGLLADRSPCSTRDACPKRVTRAAVCRTGDDDGRPVPRRVHRGPRPADRPRHQVAGGPAPASGRPVPQGPVTALVRQEDVTLTGHDSTAASATGVVVRTTRTGRRWVAHVTLSPSEPAAFGLEPTVVRAELPVGVRPAVGDRVGLRVTAAVACLPTAAGPASSSPDRSGGRELDGQVTSGVPR